jgi:cysteine desulfurase/selenocysteine lyase
MIPDGARHFLDFDGETYLNCANQGPLPRVTIAEIESALPVKAYPNRVPDDIYFRIPNRARAAIAPLIGVRPEEITIGTGASHGMNVAALGFPWREGDEVLIGSNEFPSNIYIWANAARRAGAKPVFVDSPTRTLPTDRLLEEVTARTRVIVVSLVDFGSGEVQDLDRLGAVCAERGIFLAVDATQACGVMPLDAPAQHVNLLAAAGYKWMLGPYGTGFAWLDPAWWDRIDPTYVTWTAAEGAENFNTLPRGDWRWVGTARRFDAPEAASFLNLSGLARSAEWIGEIGLGAIHEHVADLLGHLERDLPAPFHRRTTPSPLAGPILAIEADDPAPVHAAYKRLRDARIRVSLREDAIRVSPHVYNTEADIERLLKLLAG